MEIPNETENSKIAKEREGDAKDFEMQAVRQVFVSNRTYIIRCRSLPDSLSKPWKLLNAYLITIEPIYLSKLLFPIKQRKHRNEASAHYVNERDYRYPKTRLFLCIFP